MTTRHTARQRACRRRRWVAAATCRHRRHITALLAAGAGALALVACGDDGDAGPAATTTGSTASGEPTVPAPTTAPHGDPDGRAPASTTTAPGTAAPTTTDAGPGAPRPAPLPDPVPEVALERVATAAAPTDMVTRPGTRSLYVAERAGRVRVLDPDAGELGPVVLDVSEQVRSDGERGLLGLAFSRDGQRLYVSRSDRAGDSVIEEYPLAGDRPDPTRRRVLLEVDQPASNHNGGDIHLGPDGLLWIALGDGGGAGDPWDNGQDLDTLLGAILRIDPDARDAGAYGIPPDNPFADGGGRPEIWLYGVRNPWRNAFDHAIGGLWVADVGQGAAEEINLLAAPERGRGANLQWPIREGSRAYRDEPVPEGSTPPLYDYARTSPRCSITGGTVYRGDALESLVGAYLFGDLCDGVVRALFTTPDGVAARSLGARTESLVSFAEGPDGEVYTLSLQGPISRIAAP